MTTETTKKVELHLAGPKEGAPTLDDLVRLFKNLTGREPTAEDLKEARALYEKPA